MRIPDYVLRLYFVTHFFSYYYGNIRRAVVNARTTPPHPMRNLADSAHESSRILMRPIIYGGKRSGWPLVVETSVASWISPPNARVSSHSRVQMLDFTSSPSSSKQIYFLTPVCLWLKETEGETLVMQILVLILSIFAYHLLYIYTSYDLCYVFKENNFSYPQFINPQLTKR